MNNLPAPLVPADVDISGLDGFMLDVQRLFASELWALSTGDEFKAALGLWGRAWQQTPPGSLPDDDRALAAFSGAGAKWKKVKAMALRGFIKCSDGRLYHRVLCEDVMSAHRKRLAFRERTKNATDARRKRNDHRDGQRNDDDRYERYDDDASNVTSNVTSVQGQGQGQGQGQKEDNLDSAKTAARAGPSRVGSGLEQKLRDLVGLEPVKLATDFFRIQALIDDGKVTETDVIEGVSIALRRSNGRLKSWAKFENWIIGAAQDRLGRVPRSASPAVPSEPTIDMGGEFRAVPVSNIPGLIRLFVERGHWQFPSPHPGEAGCLVPDEFLPDDLRPRAEAAP